MSIEGPKIEKKDEKLEAREKLKKKLRTMVVWGIVTASSFGALKLLDKEYEKHQEGRYKPKALMTYIEKQKPLTEIEKIELTKKIDYLREQFSNRIIDLLQKSTKINKEVNPESIEVKGFEKAGLSNEDLKKLWSEKYYPKGWLDEEVAEVEYIDKREKPGKHYGLDKESIAISAHGNAEKGKSKLFFFKSYALPETNTEKEQFIIALDWHFGHESSHANDWETEAELDFKTRVEFLYDVSQNCFKKDAFRDGFKYIEAVKNQNPNIERYYKVSEYWAVCCDHYFTVPETFEELYPREFEMVDKYVKKEDSTFNAFEKVKQRDELIKEIVEEK